MTNTQKCNKFATILMIVAIVFYIITLIPTYYYYVNNKAAQIDLNYLSNDKYLTFERYGIYVFKPSEADYGSYCPYELIIEEQYCSNITDIYNGESIQSTVNSLFSITKSIFIISIIIIIIQSIFSFLSFLINKSENETSTAGRTIISYLSNYFRFTFFIINILYFIILSNRIKIENSLNSSAKDTKHDCDNSCIASNLGFASSIIGGVILISSCVLIIKSQLNKRNHSSESYRLI